jgi:hypothetical protein
MKFITLLLIVLISFLGLQGWAQEADPAFSVSVNLVKVPISVFDAAGKMVTS